MSADTDAVHHQIMTNSTVVGNREKNEVVCVSRNYGNLVLVVELALSRFYDI